MSLPSKIQAVGINKTGDFDVIEKFELPFPQNGPGNVLIKVRRVARAALGHYPGASCSAPWRGMTSVWER